VVAVATTSAEALHSVEGLRPELALVDLLSGAAIRGLLERHGDGPGVSGRAGG
jgi:hypothetical protein